MTMHDFLQSPSFPGGPRAPAARPRAFDPLRGVMRSFDPEPPASVRVRELGLCSPGRLVVPGPRRRPPAGKSG